jgi:hypothetical protein
MRYNALNAVPLALAALLCVVSPAFSQSAPPPLAVTIDARAYAELDPSIPIAVEAANDTDQAQRLKADIVAALEGRGFRVDENAPIVLEFYATEPSGAPSLPGTSLNSGYAAGGAATEGPTEGVTPTAQANQAHFQTNVFSNITDSLFGHKSQSSAAAAPPPGRSIHVNIEVNDRRAARRVWQGSAGTFTDRPDSYAVASAIVPALIERLGANTNREQVDVP